MVFMSFSFIQNSFFLRLLYDVADTCEAPRSKRAGFLPCGSFSGGKGAGQRHSLSILAFFCTSFVEFTQKIYFYICHITGFTAMTPL